MDINVGDNIALFRVFQLMAEGYCITMFGSYNYTVELLPDWKFDREPFAFTAPTLDEAITGALQLEAVAKVKG